MKRFLTLTLAIITMLALLAVPAQASERYIERSFTFRGYAPVISIDHGLYKWTLEAQNNGSLKWAKIQNRDSQRQLFLILPTDTAGYYVIREMTSEHSQRVLTYTSKGFRMEYPGTDKYGMQKFSKAQQFKFKWYTSTTCGGKTVKKCWRLVCRENNIAFCNGGWSPVKFFWINA